jgi:hypothetical protein
MSVRSRHAKSVALHLSIVVALFGSAEFSLASPPDDPLAGVSEPALTPACRAAQAFVKLNMAGQYDAIGKLFADDANFLGPDGVMRHHPEEIARAFQKIVTVRPPLRIAGLSPNGQESCLLELEMMNEQTKTFETGPIDRFQVDKNGKLISFKPFFLSSDVKRIQGWIEGLHMDSGPK